MVKVRVWGSLSIATEGREEIEVEADTLHGLLDALADGYPAMRPQLERGISISIDGRIYNDSWFMLIGPESEVVLLPRLEGG